MVELTLSRRYAICILNTILIPEKAYTYIAKFYLLKIYIISFSILGRKVLKEKHFKKAFK